MKIADALASAKYVVDSDGNKTDVVIPIETWQMLLAAWQQSNKMLPLEQPSEENSQKLSIPQWRQAWEMLAQEVDHAWQGEKSALEVLSEMRR
jgi:hypothetical protein